MAKIRPYPEHSLAVLKRKHRKPKKKHKVTSGKQMELDMRTAAAKVEPITCHAAYCIHCEKCICRKRLMTKGVATGGYDCPYYIAKPGSKSTEEGAMVR